MATAQDSLADAVIRAVTPARNIAAVNKFAPGIVEFVSTSATTLNGVLIPAPASRFGGGIPAFFTHVAGTPWKEYLVFPSTIRLGDIVKINIDGVDYMAQLPTTATVDPGGAQYDGDRINQHIPNAALVAGAGDELGGPIVQVQQTTLAPGQRAFVVYEYQPAAAGGGRLFAINANQASGIPLPAFRTVAAVPATGTLIGEAVLNKTTGLSYIWNGLNWDPIVPPSIATYPTDTAVLNDNAAAAGTYAFSQQTGNLFVRYTAGTTDTWRQIGLRTYPTQAGLLADTPADGSMGYATDTRNLWAFKNNAWQPLGVYTDTQAGIMGRAFPDGSIAFATDTNTYWVRVASSWIPLGTFADTQANILAATYPNGTRAYSTDTNLLWERTNGVWFPASYLRDTDANIQAATPTAGLIGVATDTGKLYYADGAAWIGQPFRDYPTEAALLADTPIDGIMAVAVDTGKVYYRAAGAWVGVGGNAIPVGTTDPAIAAAAAGDLFFNSTSNQAKVFVGGAWKPIAPGVLNDLADVDTTTPANDKETLVYDAANKIFKPGKGGGVVMGPEPGPPQRYSGMLWWSGARLFVWVAAANSWIEC